MNRASQEPRSGILSSIVRAAGFGSLRNYNSINFEDIKNPSRGNIPLTKRSISTRGIRNRGIFESANVVVQNRR